MTTKTLTEPRNAFLMQLKGAALDLDYATKEFNKQRVDLGRRAMQTAENPHLRSAMSDLAFVQAYMNQTAEAKARLETSIEKLKLVHYLGKAAFELTDEEFAATTGLNADTYEKAGAN